ncbi:DUF6247 family protein [Yinghuangia seranimata]|uniref:DUF6247 family protein n=1 Tax=Yinghuangia seranimata TaxID=408067 RepID=UPI00248B1877|nr:DUF6247 family protein [Yinghuangia seranimata]MDI2129567.1 DUF6247 family protein [Yinghuangia seranimata]
MTAQPEHVPATMPQPERTAEALRKALIALDPSRLTDFDQSQREALDMAVTTGELWHVRSWLRHWAAIVEIERHPETSRAYHQAERIDTMSDDPDIRLRGVRVSGDMYRAAFATVGE